MLTIESTTVDFGPIRAVDAISLEAKDGQIVGVLGANGAGKSTLFNAISGFLPLTAGQILVDGEDVTRLSATQRVQRGVSLVQEGRQIWSSLTVEEHLVLGARASKPTRSERQDRFDQVFDLFPKLKEVLRRDVGNLSGGEQQMVVIGRALMARPRVLLLDEPTLGLAPAVLDTIADSLRAMRGSDITVLVAEQNAEFALSLCDYVYVMEIGRWRLADTAAAVSANSGILHAYLGDAVDPDMIPDAPG